MKHSKDFYKKIFTKLYIRYGYHPFPKEFIDNGIDLVLDEWDESIGMFKEHHILKGLNKCIKYHEDRMPRLPKIVAYIKAEIKDSIDPDDMEKIASSICDKVVAEIKSGSITTKREAKGFLISLSEREMIHPSMASILIQRTTDFQSLKGEA